MNYRGVTSGEYHRIAAMRRVMGTLKFARDEYDRIGILDDDGCLLLVDKVLKTCMYCNKHEGRREELPSGQWVHSKCLELNLPPTAYELEGELHG